MGNGWAVRRRTHEALRQLLIMKTEPTTTDIAGTSPLAAGSPVAPAPRLAFSLRETADMLGVSEKSVRRLISRGLLRSSRALRHLLIPRKEIERFLNDTVADE